MGIIYYLDVITIVFAFLNMLATIYAIVLVDDVQDSVDDLEEHSRQNE